MNAGTAEDNPSPLTRATPEQLMARLVELNIAVTTHPHPPIMTVDEGHEHWVNIAGMHCKNLFLKDAKGAYWLVVAPIDRAVQLKVLPAVMGSKRLSFASAERLRRVLGVEPGSVTPFALINDKNCVVNVVLDQEMMEQELINFHPLVNTATTTTTPADLVTFIRSCGHDPAIVKLEQI